MDLIPAADCHGVPNASVFEDQINAWLRGNPRIKVLDIKQLASGGFFVPLLWLISIWYEERAD